MSATADEIAALLVWPPIIVQASGITEWERKFCASIIARNRSGAFRPSPAQVAVLRRIVGAFRARMLKDERVVE
jgi:hypothetical protein